MYEERFGLKRRPFAPTPDTAFYYPASIHEKALAALLRGLAEDESFVLLTGEPGTGKTLLGYVLLDRLDAKFATAFLTNSHFADCSALLQAILYDLGLDHEAATEQLLRLRLTEHLLKTCGEGRRTLIVIDEVHHLNANHLEELRLLANLEAGGVKAVQFVLLAQPGILQTLDQPGLASLKQRIAVRPSLGALAAEEACDYLLHRLRSAGGKPDKIMDETAFEVLARGAHGIPRCLNQAAHQALNLAQDGELEKVDAEAALEALAMLGLTAEETAAEHPRLQTYLQTA